MADNVQFQSNQLATPASGTQVSTDEAASGHIQRVKLTYSADGVDTHVTADADGLMVNTGAHKDALSVHMENSDIGLAAKAAIYGFNSGGAGSFEPVKVTPSGALTVEVDDGGGSLTVDNNGTFAVQATQAGTWNVNNVSGTVSLPTGAATSAAQTTIIGHLDGVEGLLTTIDADTGALAATVSGTELQVDIVSAPTITVADGGSSLTVDGTVAATQSGSWTVTANAGTGTYTVGDGGSSLTVDNGGTFAVQAAQSGTWNINNVAGTISLPTGAATETTLATANSNLLVIAGSIDNGVQDVGLRQTRISVQPTVSTTPAYTAKDAVGGKLTFTNAARTPGGTITIATAIVVDLSQQQPALDLVLFDRDFTASTDNAAFDPTDADLANVVGVVPMTRWFDFNDNSACVRTGLALSAKLNTTDLFGQLVTRSTPTFVATSDIRVILEIVQD